MDSSSFRKLRRKIEEESTPDRRLEIAMQSLVGNYFSTEQAAMIVRQQKYSHNKSAVAVALYSRIVDPGKYYKIIDELEYVTVKDQVQTTLKLGIHAEHSAFDPTDPAGYYELNLSVDSDRKILENLRTLEMDNLGENLKLCKLDGEDFELFNVDGVEFLPPRGRDGFCIKSTPEISEYGQVITVTWDVQESRLAHLGDWIDLAHPEDDDSKPLVGNTWEEMDAIAPLNRIMLNGRTSGRGVLRPGIRDDPLSCTGSFEARYYEQVINLESTTSGTENADHNMSSYKCIARSNVAFIGRENETVRRTLLETGRLEVVYLTLDEFEAIPPATDDEFATLARQVGQETFEDSRMLVFQAGMNNYHFTIQQLQQLFQCFERQLAREGTETWEKWIVKMGVVAYARCVDTDSFPQFLPSLVLHSRQAKVIGILGLSGEEYEKYIAESSVAMSKKMTSDEIEKVADDVAKEKGLGKKIVIVRDRTYDKQLSCQQLIRLLKEFASIDAKVDLTISLYHQLDDNSEFWSVLQEFNEDEKNEIMEALNIV